MIRHRTGPAQTYRPSMYRLRRSEQCERCLPALRRRLYAELRLCFMHEALARHFHLITTVTIAELQQMPSPDYELGRSVRTMKLHPESDRYVFPELFKLSSYLIGRLLSCFSTTHSAYVDHSSVKACHRVWFPFPRLALIIRSVCDTQAGQMSTSLRITFPSITASTTVYKGPL